MLFARLNIPLYREFAKQMNEDGNLTLIEVSMFKVQFGLVLSYDVKNYTDLCQGMSPPRPITPSIISTAEMVEFIALPFPFPS